MELTTDQWLQSVWMALRRIEDNLALPPAPLELPPVRVEPPDLSAIVTAVQSLNGTGPTAEDIARAIKDVLAPQAQPTGSEALGEVAEALKNLDFRLKGMGTQAYGGGSVSLTPQAMTALSPTATSTVITRYPAQVTALTVGSNADTRVAMTIYNETGSSVMYLKFGTAPTTSSYSARLGPGDYYESAPPRYSGPVTALWDGTNGAALVTEFIA